MGAITNGLARAGKNLVKSGVNSIGNVVSDEDVKIYIPKTKIGWIILGIVLFIIIMGGGANQTLSPSSSSKYSSAQYNAITSNKIITDENVAKSSNVYSSQSLLSLGVKTNFFDDSEDEIIGKYNSEESYKESLDKTIELINTSFEKAITTFQLLISSKIKENNYDKKLTNISLQNAIEESGALDYPYIICALSLHEDLNYENITYKKFKQFLQSEEILQYLCHFHIEDAYGQLNEDGNIVETTEKDGSIKYGKISLQACTLEDIFNMVNINPDDYSKDVPSMTNYELLLEKVTALKIYADYYDFGESKIDFTVDANYYDAYSYEFTIAATGMEIPLYHQEDFKTSSYGSSTVSASGCGPTSIAMITSYITGNTILPDLIAGNYSQYYIEGSGTAHSLFPMVASDYEYQCKTLSVNAQEIINELELGHPVIVTVKAGKFTKSGHIMVVRGITEDGYFLLNDPNGYNLKKYETDAFTINDVMADVCHAYSFYK